jgi:coenzyme F420-0:L-glutamate ligase/coenzyme F420-1:gamma-L-glutamate ligase
MNNGLHLLPLPGLPLIRPGDDLAAIIVASAKEAGIVLSNQDIVVIAQKVVSKAEDRFVDLTRVTPSERAKELAALTEKLPELVEVVLWDTEEIVRTRPGLLLVQHKLGFISANAGLDHSNVSDNPDMVLRLPANPDASARAIRQKLLTLAGASPPVLIIDTHGPDELRSAGGCEDEKV